MGCFPRDSPHCSSSTESKSSETKWATQRNSKDEVSSCRCSMTSLCLYLQKDFQQDVGHSSDLDQKRSGILHASTDHEENGTESLNGDRIRRKRTPSFPSHESFVPRNAQKQRRWETIDTLLCRWECDWNFFFAWLFLLISSVSTEQCQICVRNTVLVKQERGDPCWQDNLTHCSSQQKYW